MNEPIKAGDLCVVVSGAFGTDSPNKGKIVTVRSLKGDHSEHGRIWQCAGNGLTSEYGGSGMFADFAVSWLRKIPPTQKKDSEKREKDLAA